VKAPEHSPLDTFAPEGPRGVSVFADSGDQRRDPGELCDALVRCGASTVFWWCWSIDDRHEDIPTAKALAAAARTVGLRPWFWYFPRPHAARRSADHAAAIRDATGAHLCFDWEPPGPKHAPWTTRSIDDAVSCRPEAVTTVPAFGRLTLLDRIVDAGARILLPQLERSGSDGPLVERTLRVFDRPGCDVQLVTGAFAVRDAGKVRLPNDPERLRGDILRALGPTDPPRARGVAVYSLGDISRAEAAVLRETAGRWPRP
jgi:hypothetical protein